jgi:hypothetical protein
MARRVVIEWTEHTARAWWRFGSGRRGRFPGRARAFVMMLREWVIVRTHPIMGGTDSIDPLANQLAPAVRIVPAIRPPRVLTPAHIRTTVHATAPPNLRPPTVGRTAQTT